MIWLGKDHGLSAWENSVFRTEIKGMMEQVKMDFKYIVPVSFEDLERLCFEIFRDNATQNLRIVTR